MNDDREPMIHVDRLQSYLGCTLLPGLRALYERGDGERYVEDDEPLPSNENRPMRLMSTDEVIEWHDSFSQFCDLRGSCPFWIGDNSELAAVYLSGPLQGRVYFWNYDGRNDSIAYRSIDSFLNALSDAARLGSDWYQMPTDYYVDTEYYLHGPAVCLPASAEDYAADLRARDELLQQYKQSVTPDEAAEHYYTFNIMALTAPNRSHDLLSFLDPDDMWIPERACHIIGLRRYEPAVDQLVALVRRGRANAERAALVALASIGTDRSRKAAESLKETAIYKQLESERERDGGVS